MSEQTTTRIGSSTGPVNSGSGPLYYNYIERVEALTLPVPGAANSWQFGESAHWTAGHLIWLCRRYEHPDKYLEAADILDAAKAVLIVGAPGDGRRTTAVHLLIGRQDVRDVRIRVLSKWWVNRSAEEPWLPDLISDGEGLLLDLTDVPDAEYERVSTEVHELLGLVAKKGARLAIIDDERPAAHTELERLRVQVHRPDLRVVFSKYLKAEDLPTAGVELSEAQLGYLRSQPLRVLPRIMSLIKTDRGEDHTNVPAAVRRTFKQLMGAESSFKKLLEEVPDLRRRALLLTGALCNGLPLDFVYFAFTRLLTVLPQSELGPEADPDALSAAGFIDQLRTCRIAVDDDRTRRIHFTEPDLDGRALDYFWDNYPALRTPLLKWVHWAATQRSLPLQDRAQIISRFAAEALRTNRPRDMVKVFAALMRGGAPHGLDRLAGTLFAAGLESQDHGSHFRQYILDQADQAGKRAGVAPGYARLLIGLCVERVAPDYPDQAVVRLHRFCAAVQEQISGPATLALLAMVERDARALRVLVHRIAEYRNGRADRDADLFAAAVRPRRARGGIPPVAEAELVSGWRRVMATDDTPTLARHLDAWLRFCLPPGDSSVADTAQRERALRILARATIAGPVIANRLEAAAVRWAEEAEFDAADRYEVADRLSVLIDRAANEHDRTASPGSL